MWRWGGVVLGVFLWVLVFLPACSRTQYKYHVVRSGETLSEIGYAYGIPYQELAAVNNIRNPNQIQAGQRLRTPHGALYHGSTETTATAKLSPPLHGKPPPRWQPKPPPVQPPIPDDDGKFFSWPLKGTLTSRFGPRNGSFHDGIDIEAPLGSAVRAAAAGRVIFSDELRGYGKVVILKHANGFTTVYAHHHRNLVKDGQTVKRSDIVGEVGQSGRVSGPSLHFEVRSGKSARNPIHYLPAVRHATQHSRSQSGN